MQEAIVKITQKTYLFTLIHGDNINYLPMLKIMSKITSVPIFIITAHFTLYAQIEALHNGADSYSPIHEESEAHIKLALVLWQRYNERKKQLLKPVEFLIYKNIFVCSTFQQAFYNDKEIVLTKIEFGLLHLLISNRGYVLKHEQVYRHVCRDINGADIRNAVYCLISRLRQKLASIEPDTEGYIETVRNIGYRFILKDNDKAEVIERK